MIRLLAATATLATLLSCQPPREAWFTEFPVDPVEVGESFVVVVRVVPTERNEDFAFSFFDLMGVELVDAEIVEDQDRLEVAVDGSTVDITALRRFPRDGVFIDTTLSCMEAGTFTLELNVGLNDQDSVQIDCVATEPAE